MADEISKKTLINFCAFMSVWFSRAVRNQDCIKKFKHLIQDNIQQDLEKQFMNVLQSDAMHAKHEKSKKYYSKLMDTGFCSINLLLYLIEHVCQVFHLEIFFMHNKFKAHFCSKKPYKTFYLTLIDDNFLETAQELKAPQEQNVGGSNLEASKNKKHNHNSCSNASSISSACTSSSDEDAPSIKKIKIHTKTSKIIPQKQNSLFSSSSSEEEDNTCCKIENSSIPNNSMQSCETLELNNSKKVKEAENSDLSDSLDLKLMVSQLDSALLNDKSDGKLHEIFQSTSKLQYYSSQLEDNLNQLLSWYSELLFFKQKTCDIMTFIRKFLSHNDCENPCRFHCNALLNSKIGRKKGRKRKVTTVK